MEEESGSKPSEEEEVRAEFECFDRTTTERQKQQFGLGRGAGE
jgi:hypothetical protein